MRLIGENTFEPRTYILTKTRRMPITHRNK
jgi:hypothetical protein